MPHWIAHFNTNRGKNKWGLSTTPLLAQRAGVQRWATAKVQQMRSLTTVRKFLTLSEECHDTLPLGIKLRLRLRSTADTVTMTFLSNLWQILIKAPQIIGIIKAIIDIVGSAQVQKILETLRDALKTEISQSASLPTSEPERERLVKRFLRRWEGTGDRD